MSSCDVHRDRADSRHDLRLASSKSRSASSTLSAVEVEIAVFLDGARKSLVDVRNVQRRIALASVADARVGFVYLRA
jgi:hypothetical protein